MHPNWNGQRHNYFRDNLIRKVHTCLTNKSISLSFGYFVIFFCNFMKFLQATFFVIWNSAAFTKNMKSLDTKVVILSIIMATSLHYDENTSIIIFPTGKLINFHSNFPTSQWTHQESCFTMFHYYMLAQWDTR